MTETGEWLECVIDNGYEIWSEYPYSLKRKGSDKIINEHILKRDGYVQCFLNRKPYQKHRIIASQFIPNPNNLSEVDHINHNRADNRIENLRWVSHSDNGKNKTSNKGYHYTYFEELPESAEPLDFYNDHEFDGLFIDYENQKLYVFNDIKYRELLPCHNNGSVMYHVKDIANKWTYLYHKVLFG